MSRSTPPSHLAHPRPGTGRAARASQGLALALGLLALAACGPKPDGAGGSAAGPAASSPAAAASGGGGGPPVSITTITARRRDLPVRLDATGTVVPVASVDVRPQVSSVVTQVHVKEGQFVKAGQPLFTLDARADEANVARLRAQLARDEASLADARRQMARSRELLAQGFISQGAADTTQTLVESAQATVQADRAAVDAARVPLAYARVNAPASGRVGGISLVAGSSVQANQTSLLTITQLDPIDIAFSLPQRHLPEVLAALKAGGAAVTALLPDDGLAAAAAPRAASAPAATPAVASASAAGAGSTPGGPGAPSAPGARPGRASAQAAALQGTLGFVDNAVDPASGTVRVKARFQNPDARLWPGAFAKVALTVQTLRDVVVLPQAALVQGARGPLLFVAADGKAQPRPVQVLATQGDEVAVQGVQPGEKVVLDGRQNLRPGVPVVERAGASGRAASGAAPAASAAAANAADAAAPSPGPNTPANGPATASTAARTLP